jgi:Lrp/AsnC family transcriptional regulator, regulator of ectoine-degradation genes
MRLDSRDIQILVILQQNARTKIAELASQIHLSVTPTWQRVKRLESAGFITGYHARIDLLRLPSSITEIFVTILLEEHRTSATKRFEKAIVSVPEVISCHAVAGGFDYIARFFVKDITHYQRVINSLLEANVGIKEYYTYVVTQDVKDEHTYSETVLKLAQTNDDAE